MYSVCNAKPTTTVDNTISLGSALHKNLGRFSSWLNSVPTSHCSFFTPLLVSHGTTVRPCASLLAKEQAHLSPLGLRAAASFYLQSDPVALMCADTIGHRTQKLKLKEGNENGFHARLTERIEDYHLHASILNPAIFNEMCKYLTVSAMAPLEAR